MCNATADTHKILGKRLNRSQGKHPERLIGITTTIVQCKNCGLIYANPQPMPFDIQDHYGVPPENYWTEAYFDNNTNYFSNEIKTLKNLMDYREGARSLDIGAGLGKCMTALSKAGFEAYGFEPSEPFYKRAIEDMKIEREKLKIGTIEEVEYENDFFDFITFGAVLEHLPDPSSSILKALKWLKPGGIIHIEVPSSNWLTAKFINLYYSLKGLDYVGNLSPMHSPFHLFEFDIRSFYKHSLLYDYKLIFHEHHVCQTYLPRFLNPLIKPYMKFTNSGMQLSVWLKK